MYWVRLTEFDTFWASLLRSSSWKHTHTHTHTRTHTRKNTHTRTHTHTHTHKHTHTHTQFYLGFWGKSHGCTFHRHIKSSLHDWTNFITICVSQHGSPKRTKHLEIKVLLFPLHVYKDICMHVCVHACVCYDHSRASMHTYTCACMWLCAV